MVEPENVFWENDSITNLNRVTLWIVNQILTWTVTILHIFLQAYLGNKVMRNNIIEYRNLDGECDIFLYSKYDNLDYSIDSLAVNCFCYAMDGLHSETYVT